MIVGRYSTTYDYIVLRDVNDVLVHLVVVADSDVNAMLPRLWLYLTTGLMVLVM